MRDLICDFSYWYMWSTKCAFNWYQRSILALPVVRYEIHTKAIIFDGNSRNKIPPIPTFPLFRVLY